MNQVQDTPKESLIRIKGFFTCGPRGFIGDSQSIIFFADLVKFLYVVACLHKQTGLAHIICLFVLFLLYLLVCMLLL